MVFLASNLVLQLCISSFGPLGGTKQRPLVLVPSQLSVPLLALGCRIGQCGSDGVQSRDGQSESRLMDVLHGSECVLTFEDKDGDRMLVGDLPWEYDVLGQFMPLVGKDWTQSGVACLFSAIKENGYQLLFLSARAIVQAYLTRSFLLNIKQDENRYTAGRGAHLSLKRAERARVTITKIPAMVDNLLRQARAWEKERNTPFLYDEVFIII